VALFVFLPAAAWAGIVSADLVSAHDLLHGLGLACSGAARLVKFTLFAALELFLHVIERGLHAAGCAAIFEFRGDGLQRRFSGFRR
jgi:hypothetical protein